ncbi:MAG: hypothetical protein AAF242_12295, partial [Bacteroidota bacterium]
RMLPIIDEGLMQPAPTELAEALRKRRTKRTPWMIFGMIIAPTIFFYFTTSGNPPITSLLFSGTLLALGIWVVGLLITLVQGGFQHTKSLLEKRKAIKQPIEIISPKPPIWYQSLINACWLAFFILILMILGALEIP